MRKPLTLFIALLSGLSASAPANAQNRTAAGIVVVSSGSDWKMAAQVLEAIHKKPKGVTAAHVVRESAIPDEPVELLRSLLKRIRKARRMAGKLKLKPAIEHLEAVIAQLKSEIVRRGFTPGLRRRYVQAHSYLGAAHQMNADTASARAAFAAVLAISPKRKLSTKYFSTEVIQGFELMKTTLKANATIRVKTNQPMLIFVDGRLRGIAPMTVGGLYDADHVVELRRLGYVRITRVVSADARMGGVLTARVVKDLEAKGLRKQLRLVEKALRRSKRPAKALAALARLLHVNQILVCRASLDDAGATLFDVDQNKFIKRVRRISALPGRPPTKVIAQAFGRAQPVMDLQGGTAASGGSCRDNDDCPDGNCVSGQCVSDVPIYKKWWFWTIIGVAAGAVAATGGVLGTMPKRPTIHISIGR